MPWRVSDLRTGRVLGHMVNCPGDAAKVRGSAARHFSHDADDLVVVDVALLTVPLGRARAPRKKKSR